MEPSPVRALPLKTFTFCPFPVEPGSLEPISLERILATAVAFYSLALNPGLLQAKTLDPLALQTLSIAAIVFEEPLALQTFPFRALALDTGFFYLRRKWATQRIPGGRVMIGARRGRASGTRRGTGFGGAPPRTLFPRRQTHSRLG